MLHLALQAEFLETVDLRTAGKRMEALVKATPRFVQEMTLVCNLCDASKTYALVYAHFDSIQWGVYAAGVLLNLNLLMATHGDTAIKGHRHGYQSIASKLWGDGDKGGEMGSAVLSLLLVLVVLFGRGVVMLHTGLSEVPMLIAKTDSRTQKAVSNSAVKRASYRRPGVFMPWAMGVSAILIFIAMHGE